MAVLLCGAGHIEGSILQTFDNRSDFFAATTGLTIESFESEPAGNYPTGPSLTLPYTPASGTFAFDSLDADLYLQGSSWSGTYATDGSKYVMVDGDAGVKTLTFSNFASPIDAFGMAITDWGDLSSTGTFRFEDSLGDTFEIAVAGGLGNANEIFFGVTTDAYLSSVTFISDTRDEPLDGYGFDEVYTGNVIPEPSTFVIWSLLATFGVTLGWWRRRRAA
jgi:hypothetical protein